MSAPAQRGGSTLAAVMLLLVMGLMLLNAQHRQLDQALLLASDQRRYLLAYNQAASALSWGMAQRWPLERLSGQRWLCRPGFGFSACVRLSARQGVVLVRGEGEMRGGEPLRLYQLARAGGDAADVELMAEPGGWLDFCPEKGPAGCAD
ncbi:MULTISPECIES: YgdB family protein [Serratia]|uniref:Protein of uncharacterized function (DUF2509) n=1 Tax=Serratia ficaria TaxID=61651 RepID=A0A240C9J4_SERFI|nr:MULTISPECIES: YgdB family protein [Serratia]REF43331.1 uncharacterized protein DUF2509 [Serratia ficaria]CAI0696991.1 Protein of uncharacterised function (DUF2509) [Serratia ficaria]CAI1067431.1 Protein of uncharacterised function (DUF2509) [Serratia ficaria]CAI1085780.1 Protein of uncharacterised function (DUF2509) [Serratia ficaria]CAI1115378.1 Protein of uncharacterised function (DUF2509) [Serratia ficaria]